MINYSKSKSVDYRTVIAVVASESSFKPNAIHYNGGSTDYGYFQLNNLWHDQYRNNVKKHIETGIDHLKWCLVTEKNNLNRALSRYNTGRPDNAAGRSYTSYVLGNRRKIENKVKTFTV